MERKPEAQDQEIPEAEDRNSKALLLRIYVQKERVRERDRER